MWIKCVVQAKNDDNNDIITIQKVESDKKIELLSIIMSYI